MQSETTKPFAVVSGITGHVHPQGAKPRDEPRIRHNLDRYREAAERWRIYSHRSQEAKATMDRALADLRAAGGAAEAERLTDGE